MRTLSVHASREYAVHIGPGLLGELPRLCDGLFSRALVITDENVAKLYSVPVPAAELCVLPAGERNKTQGTLMRIYRVLEAGGFTRADAVIALGGGVVTDMAGFAAATYMRGMRLVLCPTTLIAQADAAIGGKCGVNLDCGKNLVGTVCQPHIVIADTDTLNTLPPRELAQGRAELIKCGCIADAALFLEVASGRSGEEQIFTACDIKRRYVELDETDNGVRHMLNFGHTLGHALERESGFSLLHGEAVAAGMAYAARLGEKLGVTEPGTASAISAALEKQALPSRLPCDRAAMLAQLKYEKKREGALISAVLLKRIGECTAAQFTPEEFLSAL